jgi:cytochrome c-type biogenesis protein CcmF
MVLLVGALAGYTLWVTADQGLRPTRERRRRGESTGSAFVHSSRLAPRRLGAYVVHFGVLVTFVAIAISANYQTEREATLAPGASAELGAYRMTFLDSRVIREPHLERHAARIAIERGGRQVAVLEPSLNFYPTQREPLGTPAVFTGATHDLYLTLMNISGGGTIGLRAIRTPAVVWIWIGVLMMVAGTGLCLLPARPFETAVAHAGVEGGVAGAAAGGS